MTAGPAWAPLFERCESPIEIELLSVLSVAGFNPMTRPYNFAELVGIAKSEDWPTLFLWVQEPMLTFRVDFLLVGYNPVRDDCRRLVVECDGHDYHSAFEAQRRDADRDRQLRPHLWGIVHYAGSEIRRDPDRIAGELIAMMVAS